FRVVVVLATPPFWFASAITCVSLGEGTLAGRTSGRERRRARPMCKRISVRLSSFLLPPREVSTRPCAPADRPRPSPTPPPRARAPAARPAARPQARSPAAPRSAAVEPARLLSHRRLSHRHPCTDRSQRGVTC